MAPARVPKAEENNRQSLRRLLLLLLLAARCCCCCCCCCTLGSLRRCFENLEHVDSVTHLPIRSRRAAARMRPLGLLVNDHDGVSGTGAADEKPNRHTGPTRRRDSHEQEVFGRRVEALQHLLDHVGRQNLAGADARDGAIVMDHNLPAQVDAADTI